jgi:hypothetical protein
MSLRRAHPQARVRHEHDINGATAKTPKHRDGRQRRQAMIRHKRHHLFLFLAAFDSKSARIAH